MITQLSKNINSNAYIGMQHPPLDKVIGGEFPYLKGNVYEKYTVPATTKTTIKSLIFNVRSGKAGEAFRQAEVTGIVNCGQAFTYIDSTVMQELRIQEYCLPNVAGADELVTPFHNAFQSPSIGEGIIVPSGSTFYIKVTPAQNTKIVWYATVFGKRGTTVDIQKVRFVTGRTTATQTILSYAPASDWTILSIYIDAEVPAHFLGQMRLDVNGSQVFESPYLGHGEYTPTFLHNEAVAGYGTGCLCLPLWDMEFYPKENIGFIPIPHIADDSLWQLLVIGDEAVLGGGGGATCFAY